MVLASIGGAIVVGAVTDDQPRPPQVSLDIEYTGDGPYNVTITHQSGEAVETDLLIHVADTRTAWSGTESGPINLGDSKTISDVTAGTTVRIVWINEGGGTSATVEVSTSPST